MYTTANCRVECVEHTNNNTVFNCENTSTATTSAVCDVSVSVWNRCIIVYMVRLMLCARTMFGFHLHHVFGIFFFVHFLCGTFISKQTKNDRNMNVNWCCWTAVGSCTKETEEKKQSLIEVHSLRIHLKMSIHIVWHLRQSETGRAMYFLT